ncbi:flagellar hook-basal body complex protein FliE [Cytobacillus oceanisediminis]|jgi:flagellar hook-basal body complex protein FliE|uniref:Flagellar hook-basal body complex protein FliE n=1 Tax=Cytobacillus oceanisediminis TaxID=665099 RepID=A0A2V2ZSM8_9BACI|nr:flagellar hook-basal body complex protein FliE [Cytobacillus oceanisediminis]PWW27373.1 flagellar hook-basal body complex protein FliE [Cytobacillus oceanisediminis]
MNKVTFMPVHSLKPAEKAKTHTHTSYEAQQSFSSVLKQSIEKINEAQIQSDVMTEKLARGENIDLHQVMITSQKASITMQAALEVRNKVIEAYQEAMRMQV